SLGFANRASGNGAVAIGDPNIATGTGAVAVGADNTATGTGAVALGNQSVANGQSAIALGNAANATGAGTIAIGQSSSATGANSVAIGNASVATRANSVSVGATGAERQVTNVAAGTAATDAVNVAQLGAVDARASQALAENQTQTVQIAALQTTSIGYGTRLSAAEAVNTAQGTALASLQSMDIQHSAQINQLFGIVGQGVRESRRGSAAAIAMSDAPIPSAPGRTSYILNAATFRGEQAVGASFAHRLDIEEPFAVTFGISHAGGKNTALRAGIAGEF
ncbi:MAG: hypothetical protein ACRCY3_08490, partial [Sphingorhabdus sp.]